MFHNPHRSEKYEMMNRLVTIVSSVIKNFALQSRKSIALLEGHTAQVNCAQFCFHYTSTLVTASEDRTFKVHTIHSMLFLQVICIFLYF